ncbi:MAG: enolase C-terminal domain-like protein [Planctomycetota bacterium]|jgi:L-alanine-DL-glutamate epimerase-like enolase superfamily enzyme
MKIVGIYETSVGIDSLMRNAVIDFSEMTASIVAIETDIIRDGRPVIGLGFGSNGRYAQGGILRERLIPRLMKAGERDLKKEERENFDPHKAWSIMMANEKPGGHGERSVAVGVIDMALWDAVAKIEEKPLYRLLAERYRDGKPDQHVAVYAAGGYYYPDKKLAGLQDELRSYRDMGYTSVKIKVGGVPLADDLKRIEAALDVVDQPDQLAIDANARFDVRSAIEFAEAIDEYGLKWYEEPCDPLDYHALAEVASACRTPMATGENLFSCIDTQNLIRYGGLRPNIDTLQMDPALSCGLVEYLRILDTLEAAGWSRTRCVPHGGHQFALHLAAGLGLGGAEAYPSVFGPFAGFADHIDVSRGLTTPGESPGIGIEDKADLMVHFDELLAARC